MNKQISDIIDKLIRLEGGYINHPSDPGGETKFGITKKTYPNLDIKNLTKDQAKEIYYKSWWMRNQDLFDELLKLLPKLAEKVFVFAVNRGTKMAVLTLQRALNSTLTQEPTLQEDGICGTKTVHAIRKVATKNNSYTLLSFFNKECEKSYRELAARNPSLQIFLKGWINRVNS